MVNSITQEKVIPIFDQIKIKLSSMQIDGSDGHEDPLTESKTKTDKSMRKNILLVGYEDEEATITGHLKERRDRLDIITIFGIPRQGKTTLAWKIYQDENSTYHFPTRIWISVSHKFNRRDVFLQILGKFIPSQATFNLNNNELAETIRKCLEEEIFLLVLDNVWSVDTWEQIMEALPLHNGEGKVLVTSRSIEVGKHLSVYRTSHELRLLDDDESWMLLQYEVFGNLEDCPHELRGIGERIATKSDGVLLVIHVIGGILADVQLRSSPLVDVREWETVARNVRDALDWDSRQHITNVVAMSYHRLSNGLRECFIFLGVFPEDYEIPAKLLYELWIAEGLILNKDGRSLEESAQENLNGLIRMNLLCVEKTNLIGKVETCRVLDMIRAFCMAKSKEENLFQEIKISNT